MIRFMYYSINHSNKTSFNSTFSANYQYLSFKYGLTAADWYINIDHLMGKVRKKCLYVFINVLMELCAIRDNITTCDIASITDIIAMIKDILCTRVGVKYSTCTWYLYLSTYLSVLDVLEYLVCENVKVLVLVLDQKVLGT